MGLDEPRFTGPLRVDQLTEATVSGPRRVKWCPHGRPAAPMSLQDEQPPLPRLPRDLDRAGHDTVLATRDVEAYCERRGLAVSDALTAFLRERLSPGKPGC